MKKGDSLSDYSQFVKTNCREKHGIKVASNDTEIAV